MRKIRTQYQVPTKSKFFIGASLKNPIQLHENFIFIWYAEILVRIDFCQKSKFVLV